MNNVKKHFSIRDLENLSGIKAHTIRIWEKRYNLLAPERSATNIRSYSLSSLQKLLNITLLYKNNYKISKIAKIPEAELPILVREIVSKTSTENHAINAMKLAMINFDQNLFKSTFNNVIVDWTFEKVFHEVFIPFLNELGMLWQTDAISPAHEHFMTSLIKQKIILHTEQLQYHSHLQKDKTFVLFLPENEIHEIGLLYLNYELMLRGYKSIYLGQTVPIETLEDVMKYFNNLHFISYFTVAPSQDKIKKYITDFTILAEKYAPVELWLLGYQTRLLESGELPDYIQTFNSIDQLSKQL